MVELVKPHQLNVKYSPGGLCEIEYGVQFLQLQHGRAHPDLKVVNTLSAMERLLNLELISPSEFENLYNCLAFHRRLINALRMVRGQAKDLILPKQGSEEYHYLSRRLGFLPQHGKTPEEQLQTTIESTFSTVHKFFRTRFIEFSMDSYVKPGLPEIMVRRDLPKNIVRNILANIQVEDVPLVYDLLKKMTQDVKDKTTLMAVMVIAQRYIRYSPYPDKVFIHFHRYMLNQDIAPQMLKQMLYHPRYIEISVLIFGYGDFLANILINNPFFIHYIVNHSSLSEEKTIHSHLEEISNFSNVQNFDQTLNNLRLYNHRELLRIGVRDLYLREPLGTIVRDLSHLADALVEGLYRLLYKNRDYPEYRDIQCILALGKLGGMELNYSSDIDIIFVTQDGLDAEVLEKIDRCNRDLIKRLTEPSSMGKLFRVDTNLRPHGAQGNLTVNYSFCEKYFNEVAEGWELQAWLKARVIAGDKSLGDKLIRHVHSQLLNPQNRDKIVKSMQQVRIKTLKTFKREDLYWDVKQSPGGIRTVEFYVQAKQIHWGLSFPDIISGHTLQSINKLKQHRLISEKIHQTLREGYVFMRKVEHGIQLEGMQQRHLFPSEPKEIRRLAKRLGYEDRLQERAEEPLIHSYHLHSKALRSLSKELFPESDQLVMVPEGIPTISETSS